MEKAEKYSYLDWLNGSICLIYSTIWISKKTKRILPTRVTWDEIEEDDIVKIKEKQIEIFNGAVTEKLEVWKDNFQSRYSKSEFPDILLTDEMNKFLGILFDPIYAEDNKVSINGILFDINSIIAIKHYVESIKIGGESFDFDIIHSTNCIYQNSVVNIDIIYAETCWRYIKWLEVFGISEKSDAENEPPVTTTSIESLKNTNPEIIRKPNLEIFKNEHSFSLFLELKERIVSKGTELADYSFIYRKLKFCDQEAIKSSTNHTIFIRYVNIEHSAGIAYTKLTTATTRKKEEIFEKIFEKYTKLI